MSKNHPSNCLPKLNSPSNVCKSSFEVNFFRHSLLLSCPDTLTVCLSSLLPHHHSPGLQQGS